MIAMHRNIQPVGESLIFGVSIRQAYFVSHNGFSYLTISAFNKCMTGSVWCSIEANMFFVFSIFNWILEERYVLRFQLELRAFISVD